MEFNPHTAYWKANGDDGRVFSGAKRAVVPKDDPAYQAWLADGNVPSVWPRDEDGAQTDAELASTLAAYGIGVEPEAPSLPVITSKLDFWRRMSGEEAEAVEMALAGAPVRDRRMVEAAQSFSHADPDFARLRETVAGMFGEDRASELLAASQG